MPYFTFRSQPLRTLYQTYFLSTTLLSIPFLTLYSLPPPLRPHRSWPLSRSLIVRAVRWYVETWWAIGFPDAPGGDMKEMAAMEEGERKKLGFEWVEMLEEGLVVGEVKEVAEKQGVKGERRGGYWYQREGVEGEKDRKAESGEKVLLHFHGGGHIIGSAHPQGGGIGPISSILLAKAPALSRVFASSYRLSRSAPYPAQNPFPAAIIDGLAAYYHLVHVKGFDPKNIIIGGDSAGGNMALAVTRYIVKVAPTLPNNPFPVPGGLLLLSPTSEWAVTHTGPQSSMRTNASSDFCNIFFSSGYTERSLLGSALPQTYSRTSPWISPASLELSASDLSDLFVGFPKTYFSAGGAEVCADSYRTMKTRFEDGIGKERLVWDWVESGTHDFLTMEWHEPERSETAGRIGQWIEGL